MTRLCQVVRSFGRGRTGNIDLNVKIHYQMFFLSIIPLFHHSIYSPDELLPAIGIPMGKGIALRAIGIVRLSILRCRKLVSRTSYQYIPPLFLLPNFPCIINIYPWIGFIANCFFSLFNPHSL